MPLEPVIVRVVIICLVFGVFFAQRIIGYWRAGSLNQKFLGVLWMYAMQERAPAPAETMLRSRDFASDLTKRCRFSERHGSMTSRILSCACFRQTIRLPTPLVRNYRCPRLREDDGFGELWAGVSACLIARSRISQGRWWNAGLRLVVYRSSGVA